MRKEDLFKLDIGSYELTDSIYTYTLTVDLTKEKERCYRITEKGSLNSRGIFMVECIESDGPDDDYKYLSVHASVGGLTVHSDNSFDVLNKLSITPNP